MKKVKGCLNNSCSEYRKTYYKESDEYCVKCGYKLSYVCKYKKCFKQIPEDSKEAYCPVHLAEMQDKKGKQGNTAKKIGVGALSIGGLMLTIGKTIIDVIKEK